MTIFASALRGSVFVMITVLRSPAFVSGTKFMNPLILVMPTPLGVVSVMSTSYLSPILTGHLNWFLFLLLAFF